MPLAVPASGPSDPIVAMALTREKSCAVHDSGRVTCRGDARPIHTLPEMADATGVAVHGDEVCVLTRGGKVRCRSYARDTPWTTIAFPEAVVQIAAGAELCALMHTGDVMCDARSPRASMLTPEHDAVDLAVSDVAHCVRHRTGSVSCAQQLFGSPEAIRLLPQISNARQLTLDASTLCVLLAGGSTRCWEISRQAPLGVTESLLPALPPFTSISAGKQFSCGLSSTGAVTCWGANYYGQLGDPDAPRRGVGRVRGIENAEAIFAGPSQACARRSDGSTWCWGHDEEGAIGDGSRAWTPLPQTPWRVEGLRQLAVADDRTCALRVDGSIACWGTRSAWTRPTAIFAPAPADLIRSRERFDCARLRTGQLACRAARPSLRGDEPRPEQGWWTIPSLAEISSFDLFFNMGFSLHDDGSLRSWHIDPRASPSTEDRRFPGVEVSIGLGAIFVRTKEGRVRCTGDCPDLGTLTGVVDIATTWEGFCALQNDGSLQCANPRSNNRLFPISGRHAALDASLANLCALSDDRRRVQCWGNANFGRTGGPETPMLDHSTIAPLPDPAQDIFVADQHICAVFAHERVACWGSNLWGQLGDSRSGVHLVPVPYPQE